MFSLIGPKYDGKYLRKMLREVLGARRLHETVTRIVIPTFDIKLLQPHVFSTFEVRIQYSCYDRFIYSIYMILILKLLLLNDR